MRTTITLDAQSVAAVQRQRATEQQGLSEAVNALIHRGAEPARPDYVYPAFAFELHARLPIDRTADVLDLLDQESAR